MAFDALFCIGVSAELEKLSGARVDKIYRPETTELDFQVYTKDREKLCLIISASMSSPRVSLFQGERERTAVPDAFCMLVRKHLLSARVAEVSCVANERIIEFVFDSFDEMGYSRKKILYAEIMGKHSNIILCDEENIVLGALYQSDITSAVRRVMARMPYEEPPKQAKLSPFTVTHELFGQIMSANYGKRADKVLLDSFLSFSPCITREIAFIALGQTDALIDPENTELIYNSFNALFDTVNKRRFSPTLIIDENGKYVEYSFIDLKQYGENVSHVACDTFSQVLNRFYEEKSTAERIAIRSRDLTHLLKNALNRMHKKLDAQQCDLLECEKMDECKRSGDLIISNIYLLKQGETQASLLDYESGEYVTVELEKNLSPSKNAERYYKKYAKYKRAKEHLTQQIEITKSETDYIESILDLITRLSTPDDFDDLRNELSVSGYIRTGKRERQKRTMSKPHEFKTPGGYTVKVGKNNIQNDALTFTADKNDIWFHVKDYHGSHTVLYTNGTVPANEDLEAAARLAVQHSKAAGGKNIAVDYTFVRYVKKPTGSKPGFVIYSKQKTAYV